MLELSACDIGEPPITDDAFGHSAYLLQRRLLRDACRALGHDDSGRHCAQCCVRAFCDAQAHRAAG